MANRRTGPPGSIHSQPDDAQSFYRVAEQRLDDAEFLLRGLRTTAAVYLAGYAIECALKALILSATARKDLGEVLDSFRGNLAHDYLWLRDRYYARGRSPQFPIAISLCFRRSNTWSTDIRYQAGKTSSREAILFLRDAKTIVDWVKARL